jgi:hypothetical protein
MIIATKKSLQTLKLKVAGARAANTFDSACGLFLFEDHKAPGSKGRGRKNKQTIIIFLPGAL